MSLNCKKKKSKNSEEFKPLWRGINNFKLGKKGGWTFFCINGVVGLLKRGELCFFPYQNDIYMFTNNIYNIKAIKNI